MVNMKKIVFGNLGLLDVYLPNQKLISDGCELMLINKDDYDTVTKSKDLEYPIYYTYNEILNLISYDNDLSYSKKVYLLEKVNESLDVLIQYIDDYNENENMRICYIVDNIHARYEIVTSQILYKNPLSEKIVFLFDELVDSFREAKRYLYFSPTSFYPLINLEPDDFLEDEGVNGSSDNESCDNESCDNESCENESDESDESNDSDENQSYESGDNQNSDDDDKLD